MMNTRLMVVVEQLEMIVDMIVSGVIMETVQLEMDVVLRREEVFHL